LTSFVLIAIVWLINLFNFLDGIDGYLSAEETFLGFSIFILFRDNIGLLLAASVLGFLFWNWQKAKIFMGDVGSTLLGYNVAIFAIYYQNTNKSSIIIWLILTSVFWLDATVTLFRRVKNKENLIQPHKKHAYQRIVQAGFSHQKTAFWALFLNIVGFGLIVLALIAPTYALFLLLIDIIILYFFLKIIDKKKPFEYNYYNKSKL
jgi:UDP-N-acetylmuramyl pentapeptide phosphotransferase/UDP-N-acetylglucosamine-1-phosphate transferase